MIARIVAVLGVCVVGASACGSDDDTTGQGLSPSNADSLIVPRAGRPGGREVAVPTSMSMGDSGRGGTSAQDAAPMMAVPQPGMGGMRKMPTMPAMPGGPAGSGGDTGGTAAADPMSMSSGGAGMVAVPDLPDAGVGDPAGEADDEDGSVVDADAG